MASPAVNASEETGVCAVASASEFLGNVSHELKTPIQSIQGYIHTLLDGALEDKKVNRVFLNKASNGVDRLVELVDDLTSISQFESNAVNLDFQKFDIKPQPINIQENYNDDFVEVDAIIKAELEKENNYKFSAVQRTAYKTVGGAPHLDGTYTVFGEVLSGMEVVDKIVQVKTDDDWRPLEDIWLKKVTILK